MTEMNQDVLNHILTHLPLLLNRDFLIDIFTDSEKNKAILHDDGYVTAQAGCWIYEGKFLNIDNTLYVITTQFNQPCQVSQIPEERLKFEVKSLNIPAQQLLCPPHIPITLQPGIIENHKGTDPLVTTVRLMMLNYTILVDPFGDLVPYINTLWNIGKIEQTYIFDALRTEKITVEQIKHYSRNLHFIGHFTELGVPSFTEKSMTVDPAIIKRRDELLKEYKTEIEAGDPVIMNKIESELIAMDKAQLKGDASTPFYDYSANKSYGIARKSMYLLGGMSEKFGEPGYNFITSSLEEGWKIKDLPAICNQVRAGSYSRAKETAKGGEETKFLIRVFQNTRVIEEDCKTTDYLQVNLTIDLAKNYLYRNVIIDDEIVTLTDDNISSYIGKTVSMRSPQYCHTQNGFCFTCMGELFRTIDMEHLTMAAIGVTSSMVLASLKKAHGTANKMIEIKSLNKYVI